MGANKLEARQIKKVLGNVAGTLKDYGDDEIEVEETKKGSKRKSGTDNIDGEKKEAFVIWGSLEVPKLFANSH